MNVTVVRTHTSLPEQTSLGVLPQVEVLLREGAYRGNARGARGSGHEDDVVFGNGAHLAEEGANMLGIALRLLVDEGKLLNVAQRLDVLGGNAGLVETTMVVHGIVVGVLHHLLKTLELKLLKLGARHALDFGIVVFLIVRDVLFRHA